MGCEFAFIDPGNDGLNARRSGLYLEITSPSSTEYESGNADKGAVPILS